MHITSVKPAPGHVDISDFVIDGRDAVMCELNTGRKTIITPVVDSDLFFRDAAAQLGSETTCKLPTAT